MASIDLTLLKNVLGQKIMHAFADQDVSEIIVNSDGNLLIEHRCEGKNIIGAVSLPDMAHAMSLIAQHRGLYINDDCADLSVALPKESPFEGARMQALLPPIVQSPCFTIRKHLQSDVRLSDYVNQGIVSIEQATILQSAIGNYRNIIISGQPKSGKTTLTKALLAEIPHVANAKDRILVLEDIPELCVGMEDVEYLRTTHTHSMSDLVRVAMRKRPDRIVVGEVTDKAALGLLKAWNTGCPGGISTLHSNGAEATCQRLIDLACENNIAPPINLINSVVDVLVHIERSDQYPSKRQVTQIEELTGFDREKEKFITQPIGVHTP